MHRHHRHLADMLVEDHNHILEALDLIPVYLDKLSKGELEPRHVERLIEFLSHFADRCHHGKEEDILFPLMERRGAGFWEGPLGVMTCEHGMGRYLLRNARNSVRRYASGDGEALRALRHYLEGYRRLLTQHIDKENNILFPMARQLVREGEGLEEAHRAEEEMDHESYLRELEELKRLAGWG